jgi:putative SOS response-associated peptidase YedK
VVQQLAIRLVTNLEGVPSVFERYNIAPTQAVAVVLPCEQGRSLTAMRWGFIPQWMKPEDEGIPPGWINARSETAATKPTFRAAFKYRRCLVPASGFYEWAKSGGRAKQPYLIHPGKDELICFAGLWETWSSSDGSHLNTVTILTTDANPTLKAIHHRMPVVLRSEDYDRWIMTDPSRAASLTDLLQPADERMLDHVAVSRRVNSPRHDDPGCHEIVDPPDAEQPGLHGRG